MHLLFFLNFSNNWVFPVEGTWSLHCRGVTSAVLLGPGRKRPPSAARASTRSCLASVRLQPFIGPFL